MISGTGEESEVGGVTAADSLSRPSDASAVKMLTNACRSNSRLMRPSSPIPASHVRGHGKAEGQCLLYSLVGSLNWPTDVVRPAANLPNSCTVNRVSSADLRIAIAPEENRRIVALMPSVAAVCRCEESAIARASSADRCAISEMSLNTSPLRVAEDDPASTA